MIPLAGRWFAGFGEAAVPRFAEAGVSVAVDPGAPTVLDELREALWQRSDDALVCCFRLDGPCRFCDEADFRAFFEAPAARAALVGATENLSGDQAAYLLGKPAQFEGVAFGFEPASAADVRKDFLAALGSASAADAGARLVEVLAERCLADDVRVFRSARRWPYWLVGDRANAFIVHDRQNGRVVVVAVLGAPPFDAFVRPTPYGGEALASFETRWPHSAPPPLDLEPATAEMPVLDAFVRSFRLANPNSAVAAMRFSAPVAHGTPANVARRFDDTDLLPRLLGAAEVGERLRCAPMPSPVPGGRLRFHRLDTQSRARRFAAMLAEGGTFGERCLETPAAIERLVSGLTAELWGADPAGALVYETYDRWSPWFRGLLRATTVGIDPATGRVAILLICEWD